MRNPISQLDVFISKTCNLSCHGCLTFSDHRLVKGIYRYNEAQLAFWSQHINPAFINMFGGEPLINPDLELWLKGCKQYFPNSILNVQTNGALLNQEHYQMQKKIGFNIIISQHLSDYGSVVWDYINYWKSQETFDLLELEGVPAVNGYGQERGWRSSNGYYVHLHESFSESVWWEFYAGTGETARPKQDYFSNGAEESWEHCVARDFINLVDGDLYRCPASAGLFQTGPVIGLDQVEEWKPYFENYKKLQYGSDSATIDQWLEERAYAQNICNMCTRNPQNELESQKNVRTKVKLNR